MPGGWFRLELSHKTGYLAHFCADAVRTSVSASLPASFKFYILVCLGLVRVAESKVRARFFIHNSGIRMVGTEC